MRRKVLYAMFSLFSSQKRSNATATAMTVTSSATITQVEDRVRGALWGFFAGDALSAPTHWFYGGERQVIAEYGGPISDFTKPNERLAGSILNKSDLNGGGRSSAWSSVATSRTIIGDVINHGKKDLWSPSKSIHYHATLQKGENTLEAQLARVLMRSMAESKGKFSQEHFRQAYIKFMTTPGSHNDTYASTCHRMFFANLVHKKLPPEKCPDNDQHNVDVIDGLVLPTITSLVDSTAAGSCAATIRKSRIVEDVSSLWGKVVQVAILQNDDESFQESLRQFAMHTIQREPNRSVRDGSTMSACYLQQSLPGMIDMIAKYNPSTQQEPTRQGEAVWEGLLANSNVGGENVHRGSIMGAIWGARAGASNLPPKLIHGLYPHDELAKEIDSFVLTIRPLLEQRLAQRENNGVEL